MNRGCKGTNERGEACGQVPHAETGLCFWHDPATEREAAEARRLGGANHNREKMLEGIYGVGELGSAQDIQRLYEIAMMIELALDNSHNKARTLTQIASAASKHLEVTALQRRVESLEATLEPRQQATKDQQKHRFWNR
jgi:hypothetical protein